MITELESDILECEVNWALGSITTNKASEGDRILAELLQIVKDDAMKVLLSRFPDMLLCVYFIYTLDRFLHQNNLIHNHDC